MAELVMLLWHARNMAEPSIITPEEYHDIYGSSDEENGNEDAEGSDIDVQEVDSDEEVEEMVMKATTKTTRLMQWVKKPRGQTNLPTLLFLNLTANLE